MGSRIPYITQPNQGVFRCSFGFIIPLVSSGSKVVGRQSPPLWQKSGAQIGFIFSNHGGKYKVFEATT